MTAYGMLRYRSTVRRRLAMLRREAWLESVRASIRPTGQLDAKVDAQPGERSADVFDRELADWMEHLRTEHEKRAA